MSSEKFIVADCFDFFNRQNSQVPSERKVEQFLLLLLKVWNNSVHPVSKIFLCFWKHTFFEEKRILEQIGCKTFECENYSDFTSFCFENSIFLTNDRVFFQVLHLSTKIRIVKYFTNRTVFELARFDLSDYGRYSKEDWIHFCVSRCSDKDHFSGVQGNSLASAHDFCSGKYHDTPSHRYWQRKAFFERRKVCEIFLSKEQPPEVFDLDLFLDLCSARFPRTLPLCLRIKKRREKR